MRRVVFYSTFLIAIILKASVAAGMVQSDAERLDQIAIEQQTEAAAKREAAIAKRIAREKAQKLQQENSATSDSAGDIAARAADAIEAIEEDLLASSDSDIIGEEDNSTNVYALTPETLTIWSKEGYTYGAGDNPELYRFQKNLKEALAGGDLSLAAAKLAADYNVNPKATQRFLTAYLTIEIHSYLLDKEPVFEVYRDDLIESLRSLSHADFVIVATVAALSNVENCQIDDWRAVMEGAPNPTRTAWLIAHTDECSGNFVRFLEIAPAHAMPMLIEMAHYGTIKAAGSLPIYEWLAQQSSRDRIAPYNRQELETILFRRQLSILLQNGFNERALALVDNLSDEKRSAVMAPDKRNFVAEVDGLPIYIEGKKTIADLKVDLVAAYALVGREDEARQLFSNIPQLQETRDWFACYLENRTEPKEVCKYKYGRPTEVLLLDHYFNSPEADPYRLAEALFATSISRSTPSAAMAELRCQIFAAVQNSDICENSQRSIASRLTAHESGYDKPDHDAGMAAIAKLNLPGWQNIAERYEKLVAIRIAEAGTRPEPARYERISIEPLPSTFAEKPLPDGINPSAAESKEWPKDWARLPTGYYPVRWEQQGKDVTVISTSPFYDPTGEISQGGYWLHLSSDGGKNWQETLYTGLSEFFPYAVQPVSDLPLLNNQRITLEVSIKQIDTASITYPPVGLRLKREKYGLFLDIPLESLRRDSDNDGMTDIAEAHLLLDREGKDAPAILGRIGGTACSGPPSREKLAQIAILRKLFTIETKPIIEPVDRNSDEALSFGDWRTSQNNPNAPLFLKGKAEDFACISAESLVVIYNEEHIEALQRRTPDFRTIALPKIVWNRARDRGYVKWSAGWVGGTLQLIWNGTDWDLKEISSWIT